MRTLHLGPEELLVAVKVGVAGASTAADISRGHRRGRGADPGRGADRPGDLHRAGDLSEPAPDAGRHVRPLQNPIRPYAWGSRTAIAALQGRPVPSPGPEAELWLGAHPSAPSHRGPVSRWTRSSPPIRWPLLGPRGAATGSAPRLPYLLKVLAAAEPLSLQVHPDARPGRGRLRGRGPAGGRPAWRPTTPTRSTSPSCWSRWSEFDALCGFRDPEVSAAALAVVGRTGARARWCGRCARGNGAVDRLRAAVELMLGWPGGGAGPSWSPRWRPSGEPLAADLAQRYPGDVGVVLALLLNRVRLRPDEAIFMPAGNLHAYLRGIGVEVMAASDNVARAGLTPKRVDPAEVMRLLRYEVLADPVVRPVRGRAGGADLAGPGARVRPAPGGARRRGRGPAGRRAPDRRSASPVRASCARAGPAAARCGTRRGGLRRRPGEPAVEVGGDDAVVFQASVRA